MERVLIAVALVVVSAAAAFVLNRRRPAPPTQGKVPVPSQLDRQDFAGPDQPWLVVLWTSETCASCHEAAAKASLLAGPEVAYDEIPWQHRKELHDRYGIEDVPLLVLADAEGVVRLSYVGRPDFAELTAAVGAARDA
jgi:cytochrome c553